MLLLAATALIAPASAVVVSTRALALPGMQAPAPPAQTAAAPARTAPAADPALGRIALKFLAGKAADPDSDVRAAVAAAWGEIGNPAALPLLKKAAKDKNDLVRIEAAVSLFRLGDEKGRGLLMELVANPTASSGTITPALEMKLLARTKARALALMKLSNMGSEEVVGLMEKTLRDPSGEVRDATAVALCRLGLDEFAKQFLDAAQDKDDTVRAAAVKALGDTGLAAARDTLAAAAGDPSAAVRAEAVGALAAAADAATAPVLVERLQDENLRVRYLAVGGLARMAQDSAVAPVLRRLAADAKTPDLALRAMSGLASRGEDIDLDLAERSLAAKDLDGCMLALDVIAAAAGEKATRLLVRVMEEDPAARVRVQAASMLVKRMQKGSGR
ncbi:MAG: HEAT repeat domain-containing protein [Elusimicrobiota bacterium]|jgi:HEAT repeat protein